MVANLSAISSAGDPYRLSLLNRTCGADASDKSMALFTFGGNLAARGRNALIFIDLIIINLTSFIISLSPEHEPGTILDRL